MADEGKSFTWQTEDRLVENRVQKMYRESCSIWWRQGAVLLDKAAAHVH